MAHKPKDTERDAVGLGYFPEMVMRYLELLFREKGHRERIEMWEIRVAKFPTSDCDSSNGGLGRDGGSFKE